MFEIPSLVWSLLQQDSDEKIWSFPITLWPPALINSSLPISILLIYFYLFIPAVRTPSFLPLLLPTSSSPPGLLLLLLLLPVHPRPPKTTQDIQSTSPRIRSISRSLSFPSLPFFLSASLLSQREDDTDALTTGVGLGHYLLIWVTLEYFGLGTRILIFLSFLLTYTFWVKSKHFHSQFDCSFPQAQVVSFFSL